MRRIELRREKHQRLNDLVWSGFKAAQVAYVRLSFSVQRPYGIKRCILVYFSTSTPLGVVHSLFLAQPNISPGRRLFHGCSLLRY